MRIFEINETIGLHGFVTIVFMEKLNQFVVCSCFVKDKASLGTIMATMYFVHY
jgi:hypothetical protein